MARLAGSEPPASPPESQPAVKEVKNEEPPAPMEEDEAAQKPSVTLSQSSVIA